ncbi:MAG: DUF805 domain-containing protein [Muribaculaceae bacterium]|nr:DUF805 domain-containing protein [Muribaculaceae bacterium]MDE6135155.1 DUF805 domain-containing protein [Muribaculaceae bacterium]
MQQRELTFEQAVRSAIQNHYCDFKGRASRSEYWWFVVFNIVISIAAGALGLISESLSTAVSGIISLALLLPGLGLSVRRLHDTDRSGWYLLLALIPLVGAIILIIWFAKASTPAENQYGPVPNVE